MCDMSYSHAAVTHDLSFYFLNSLTSSSVIPAHDARADGLLDSLSHCAALHAEMMSSLCKDFQVTPYFTASFLRKPPARWRKRT